MSGGLVRKVVVGALTAVLVATSAGCGASSWRQVGHDPAHSGRNADETVITAANVATLTDAWTVELLRTASEPIVADGRVIVSTNGPDIDSGFLSTTRTRAINVTNGKDAWSTELFSANCPQDPVAWYPDAARVGDEVWAGYFMVDVTTGHACGQYRNPVRLNAATGAWLADERYPAVSAAVESGDVVVQTSVSIVGTPTVQIVVRDASTAAVLWTGIVPGFPVDGTITTPPVVDGGMIYVAHRSAVHAFPLGGCATQPCAPVWSSDQGATVTQLVSAAGKPFLYGESGSRFLVLDRATGDTLVALPLGAGLSGVAVGEGVVFTAIGTHLNAMTPDGTDVLWSAALPSDATAGPVIAGDVVYVGRADGVDAFPAAGCGASTCDVIKSLKVTGAVDHVTVADGRVFVVSALNDVSSLTAFSPG